MNERINLDDFEAAAPARLPAGARDYYRGGASDEVALRENRAAWKRWPLHYRVLRDVAERDLSTTVPGATIDWPVMIAPTAHHRMAHADGELGVARAAAAHGTAMVLSTLSNTAMEDVVRESMRRPAVSVNATCATGLPIPPTCRSAICCRTVRATRGLISATAASCAT